MASSRGRGHLPFASIGDWQHDGRATADPSRIFHGYWVAVSSNPFAASGVSDTAWSTVPLVSADADFSAVVLVIPGTVMPPVSPESPGTAMLPVSPGRPGRVRTPFSPGRPGTAMLPVSPGRPGMARVPFSPGSPGTAMLPVSPGRPGRVRTPFSPGRPGTVMIWFSSGGAGKTVSPVSNGSVLIARACKGSAFGALTLGCVGDDGTDLLSTLRAACANCKSASFLLSASASTSLFSIPGIADAVFRGSCVL